MVLGGFRIGDTFHLIPLIDSLKNDDVTWVTGTYERPAAELIAKYHPQIKELVYKYDGLPMDFNNRRDFIKKYSDGLDKSNFDVVIDDPTLSNDWTSPFPIKEGSYFPEEAPENYIALHSKSISSWKNRDVITNTKFPLMTKSLDELKSMEEAFRIINRSRFLVGIHSAMACLAVYCNKPLICCGTGQSEMKFAGMRKFNIDLDSPDSKTLLEAVEIMTQRTTSLKA